MKVGLTIFAGPQSGTTVVRLTRDSSGWSAGVVGASRNTRMFDDLVHNFAMPFGQAGVLLGVSQG